MDKLFFEAFPSIQLDNDLHNALNDSMVTKVSTNSSKDAVSVYLYCRRVIPKRRIRTLEEQIKKQIFSYDDIKINVIEKFELSSQYSVESFYNEYIDSIYHEISEYSSYMLAVIKRADFVFEEDKLTIVLEDNMFTRSREEEIIHIFHSIFCDRAGLNVIVDVDYKEAKKTNYQEKNETYIRNKVDKIVDRLEEIKEREEEEREEDVVGSNNKGKQNNKRTYGLVRSSNKDVMYGKDFDGDAINISELNDADCGNYVIISGEIFGIDYREIRNEKTIATVSIYDGSDSIDIKFFLRNDLLSEFKSHFKEKQGIKVKGILDYDNFTKETNISRIEGVKKTSIASSVRMDNSIEKRVELHCHTKFSEMDGVSYATDIYKQAKKWGHKALAITDHGVVQAFTEKGLMHGAYDDPDFKMILGCEAYIVDDYKGVVTNSKGQSLHNTYVVFDIETTGRNAYKDKIIEIGAVKVEDDKIVDKYSTFVNPKRPIPYEIFQLTSITDDDVIDAPTIDKVLPEFLDF